MIYAVHNKIWCVLISGYVVHSTQQDMVCADICSAQQDMVCAHDICSAQQDMVCADICSAQQDNGVW